GRHPRTHGARPGDHDPARRRQLVDPEDARPKAPGPAPRRGEPAIGSAGHAPFVILWTPQAVAARPGRRRDLPCLSLCARLADPGWRPPRPAALLARGARLEASSVRRRALADMTASASAARRNVVLSG